MHYVPYFLSQTKRLVVTDERRGVAADRLCKVGRKDRAKTGRPLRGQQRTSSTQEVEGLVDAHVRIAMCRIDDKVVTVPIIVCAQNDCMPVGQGQSSDVT